MNTFSTFYCFICDKNVKYVETMNTHIEEHINYNRYTCLECDSQFKDSTDLELHQEFSDHMDFKRTTNMGIRKLVKLLVEMSNKVQCPSDVKNVELSVDVKIDMEKCLEDFFPINIEEELLRLESFEKFKINHSPKKIKTETIDLFHIGEVDDTNNKDCNDFKKNVGSSRKKGIKKVINSNIVLEVEKIIDSNNTSVKEEILKKIIKMKEHKYFCTKSLESQKFIKKGGIVNKCLQCDKTFVGGNKKIEHVLKDHMMLKEFKLLECMYCIKNNIKSDKFLDITSVQNHYKQAHKVSRNGCPNNLASGYTEKEEYIHINGNVDILHQYETNFVKCFVNDTNKNKKCIYI